MKIKISSDIGTLMKIGFLFCAINMLFATRGLAQKTKETIFKAHSKKVKQKKKITYVLHLAKRVVGDGENEKEDGVQQRLDYEFERTKDPATNTVPQFKLINAFNSHQQSVVQQKLALSAINRSNNGGITSNGINGGITTNGTNSPIQTTPWVERGPSSSNAPSYDNNGSTSGRSDAFWADLDPNKLNQVFVGGNNGGLWTCPDITQTVPAWTFIDNFVNIAISSICQDPTNTDILYFGTGEKLARVLGGGIWKSINHGATWSFLASTTAFYNVSKVLCDKNGYLYAGMVQFVSSGSNFTNGGLMRSKDGGATWADITPNVNGINSREVSDMVYDVSIDRMGVYLGYQYTGETQGYCYGTPSTITAGTWSTPASSAVGLGLYATLNSGNPRIRQTELSAKAGVVWALQGYSGGNSSVNGGSYTNLYRSTDAGVTWSLQQSITSSLFDAGQNWYALGIDCDPLNASKNVVVGGLNPFKSTDGGTTLAQVARWVASTQAGPVSAAQFVHADIHNIIYNTNASGLNRVICMDDGGINYSADGGSTWQDRNIGLRTVELYSCSLNPSDPNYYLGGAQDNGSHQFTQSGLATSFQVSGGDGAFTAIDQLNPNNQVTAYIYNNYYVATDKGINKNSSFIGTNIDYSGQFINPFDFDSKTKKLYASTTGGQYLRWDDPLTTKNTFPKITVPAISGKTITAITVSPNLNNTIYMAAGGVVVKATNANTGSPSFTTITPPTITAGSNISSIVVGPSTTDLDLMLTSSSYNTNKVFISSDGGNTWTNITGDLPDMPVNWSLFYPGSNTQVYLATNLGVWYTSQVNGASTVWQADITIPKVGCRMIKYNGSTNTIALATYGRGLWTSKISTNPKVSFYPALLATSKSFDNTSASCRSYFDYSDSLQISDPPTGAATVSLSVQGGNTATLGVDFDFTTNGSFTSPSSSVVFNSGTYPNKIPFTIRVYNNHDKNAVLPQTANLVYTVSGTTDAVTSTSNQNLAINLTDVFPIATNMPTQTIWSENWEAWPATFTSWTFLPEIYYGSPANAVAFIPDNTSCLDNINTFTAQLYSTNSSGSNVSCTNIQGAYTALMYRAINGATNNYSNLSVTFNYKSGANTTITNSLVYSINSGTTWNTLATYAAATATTSSTVVMPSTLNNKNFLLGWQSVGTSAAVNSAYGFGVDDIIVTGDIAAPPIDSTVSSTATNYESSSQNIDFYSANNNIFGNITNSSADLGCVSASIENAGNTWQSYQGGTRSQKTFLITPATNGSTANYNATLYFTNTELAGINPSTIRIAKTSASSIATSNGTNTVLVTPTTATYNAYGVAFTGSFSGFSRFFLVDNSVALPITLIDFKASLINGNSELTWITSSEKNNRQFDVEVSTDGINFVKLGTVLSKGNSTTNVTYNYTQIKPAAGVNYYRLKQIDLDGAHIYTNIVVVQVRNNSTDPFLYPNPAHKSITLNLGSAVPQVDMSLYSIDMRLLRTQNLTGAGNYINIDISQLPAGIYMMQVNKNGNKVMLHFVKE